MIAEEDEDDEHEERSEAEKQKKNRKKRNKVQFVPVVPVSMIPQNYIDPRNMPIFSPSTRTPYQVAFIPPPSVKQKAKGKRSRKEVKTMSSRSPTKDESSTTSLPPMKMVTFSNLQQVRKHTHTSQRAQPTSRMYDGHAAMQLNTVTKRNFRETRQLTKTVSDSVVSQKRK